MEFFDLPIPDQDEVLEPEKALDRVQGVSPLDLLTRSRDFETRLATILGIDISELKVLEREGALERLLSTSYYAVALKALESLAGAISNGELPPEALIKASVELSKTAFKLSGREVHKHLVLNEEKLLELLTELDNGERNSESEAESQNRNRSRNTEYEERSLSQKTEPGSETLRDVLEEYSKTELGMSNGLTFGGQEG